MAAATSNSTSVNAPWHSKPLEWEIQRLFACPWTNRVLPGSMNPLMRVCPLSFPFPKSSPRWPRIARKFLQDAARGCLPSIRPPRNWPFFFATISGNTAHCMVSHALGVVSEKSFAHGRICGRMVELRGRSGETNASSGKVRIRVMS